MRTAVALALFVIALAAGPPAQAQGGGTAETRERNMGRLNYVELPARDVAASRRFYESAFGWSFTEFAPTYAATTTGETDLGLDGDTAEAPRAPLPVIQVDDVEAALSAVEAAGGRIVRPIFAFPGGRRFHFVDPGGNEVAAWQAAPEE